MSKYIDKLNKIVKGETVSMGFRRAESGAVRKQIQMVALRQQSDTGDVTGADAILFDIDGAVDAEALKSAAGDILWGARLKKGGQKEVKVLESAGCDFIVMSTDVPVTAVEGNDTGKVLEVEGSIADALLRSLAETPVDAVLVALDNGKAVTWQDLMTVQRFGGLAGKALFVQSAAKLSAAELEALWNAGVNAIVTDGDTAKLRKEIDKADFSKMKKDAKGSPLIGKSSAIASDFDED